MEMIYKNKRQVEILKRGAYHGYEYLILSLGTHPTAYINLDNENFIEENDDIGCHGGITFKQKGYIINNKKIFNNSENIIGWDYAHLGDRYGENISDGNSYTTEEIYNEIKHVIDNIKEIKNVSRFI